MSRVKYCPNCGAPLPAPSYGAPATACRYCDVAVRETGFAMPAQPPSPPPPVYLAPAVPAKRPGMTNAHTARVVGIVMLAMIGVGFRISRMRTAYGDDAQQIAPYKTAEEYERIRAAAAPPERPSRVMRSIAFVPKLAIRMSPLESNARPFGSVPRRMYFSVSFDCANPGAACCATSCCVPSGRMRMTPPRASALHSVPSRSARMHSGRCRSWPMVWIALRSTCQPRNGFTEHRRRPKTCPARTRTMLIPVRRLTNDP